MFSLIITIISIALVAVLALATLYYGGDAFNQGKAGAEASRLINEGQQLNAAFTLAAANNVAIATWGDLTSEKFLSQLPAVFGLTAANAVADSVTATATQEVCLEVEKRATGDAGLEAGEISETKQAGRVYGCYGTGPATYTFFYEVK